MQTIKELGLYTFQAVLNNSLKRFSKRPCCNFPDQEPLTYADVNEKIIENQKLLYSLGVSQGDKVAIYARNSPNWIISYLAIVTYGAIVVPLMPDFSKEEVKNALEHSDTETVFVAKKLLEKVPDSIKNIIQLDDFSVLRSNVDLPEDYSADKVDFENTYIAEEDDVSTIIYTSGTTGRSKGVVLTNKNLVWNAVQGQDCYRVYQTDVVVSILPLAHVYEFMIGFLMIFLNGAHIVYLAGPPIPSILLPTLKHARPNIILAVPLIMEKIYKSKVVPALNKTPLRKKLMKYWIFRKFFSVLAGKKIKKAMGGRIQFFGLGGSKLDTEIEKFLKMAGFPYALGYGLTETSALVIHSAPNVTKPGSIGFVLNGLDVKIIDKNAEGVGELVVKGPNVMKEYYKAPELTAKSFTKDGYFRTGDLFSKDKKGRFSIRGRIKNLILDASGENIYPEDIEFVLNQHEIVSESLVIAGEHSSLKAIIKINEEKLKKIKAEEKARLESQSIKDKIDSAISDVSDIFVTTRDRLLDDVKLFVNSKVNARSKINDIEVVDEFEKTASGKIKRYIYDFFDKNKKS
ncbi:MAG: AMP-binding protein [Treponemataceae bacterium]